MSSAAVRAADAFKAQIIAPTPDWSVLADNFVFESDEGSVGKAVFVEQIRALGGILVGTTTEDVVALPVGETVLFTVVKRFIGPKTRVNHVMARADGAGKMNRLFELPKTLPDQEAQTGALAFCRPLFDATLDALSAKGFEKCAADCPCRSDRSVLTRDRPLCDQRRLLRQGRLRGGHQGARPPLRRRAALDHLRGASATLLARH